MKADFGLKLMAMATITCAILSCSAAFATTRQSNAPQISEGEQKSIDKIKAANSVPDKLKAAADFVKKNSKSQARAQVAAILTNEIGKVTDFNQRIGFIETYSKTFNQSEEIDLIKPLLIESLIGLNKYEEAFKEGSKYIERNPEDVVVLTMVASAGANQANKQIQSNQTPSNEMLQKTTAAGAKAVELLETDKKPEKMDPAFWTSFRNTWLPRLYQAQGMILFASKDKAGARDKLEKAAGLDPYDPNTLLLLSNVLNDEYTSIAERYQAEKKESLLNEALQKLDELIDCLARAAGATQNDAKYNAINGQIMEQLKQYYAYRHNQKTDGLNELIQKYKKP